MLFRKSPAMPSAAEALPGRMVPLPTASTHFVNGHSLKGPWPEGFEVAIFAMGVGMFALLAQIRSLAVEQLPAHRLRHPSQGKRPLVRGRVDTFRSRRASNVRPSPVELVAGE